MKTDYDVIVVGGGSAGLPAAIYSARFNLKTLVIVKERGGLITQTHVVENYPGFKSVSGLELMEKMLEHAKAYDLITILEDEVIDVKKHGDCFSVKTKNKEFPTKTVVFATGTKRRKLNVPGEKEFENKGVSYCAVCDAPLFKNKNVIVVGGSDSAAKEALLLSEYCKKVYILYRGDKIRPEPINAKRVEDKVKKGKIEIITNTNVLEIKGDKFVTHVILDKPYKGNKEFKIDGVFIEIGGIPEVDLAKKLGVKLDEKGEIIINKNSETNVKGVYAAGDVANNEFKQAITGAAEGVIAAYSAYKYINEGGFICTPWEIEK